MSLDFNLKDTALPVREDGRHDWTDYTEAVIFATMGTDIGHITEENVDEFYTRAVVFGRLIGSENYPSFTVEELRPHVGLRTNVATLTRAQWWKRMALIVKNEERDLRRSHEARIAKFRKDIERERKREEKANASRG